MKRLCVFFVALFFAAGAVFANPGNDALVLAAARQDAAAVRRAMAGGANVNHLRIERTALMEAADRQWLEGVRILLVEFGANPSFQNAHGETALMFAAGRNFNLDIVRSLTDRGANVNASTHQGKTALMFAAQNQNPHMVDFLIERGANVGATDTFNRDALMIAAENNNQFAVARLLRAPGVNHSQATMPEGRTAFIIAAERQNMQLVTAFVQSGFDVLRQNDVTGLPPLLHLIQHRGSFAVIEYLLRSTNAIASRDRNGNDAMWYLNRFDNGNARLRNLLQEARVSAGMF